MDKNEFLSFVRDNARGGLATREEVLAAYDEGTGRKSEFRLTHRIGVSEILYYIGGAIVFLGIAVLIWQHWDELGPFTRILVTFGAGMVSYALGSYLSRVSVTEQMGQAFYLISALVTPIGIGVIFHEANFDVGAARIQSLISGILLAVYLVSYAAVRRNIFVVFSVLFGTWLFFAFTSFLMGGNPVFEGSTFAEYRILVLGLTYMLLGFSFVKTERVPLSGSLYGFGALFFLGAALALGGWSPDQSVFWELIFPALVFGIIFLSIVLKSKAFLAFGSAFLMIYILKITGEYFTDSIGWSLSLVVAGLLLIFIGYFTFYLNKKYISA